MPQRPRPLPGIPRTKPFRQTAFSSPYANLVASDRKSSSPCTGRASCSSMPGFWFFSAQRSVGGMNIRPLSSRKPCAVRSKRESPSCFAAATAGVAGVGCGMLLRQNTTVHDASLPQAHVDGPSARTPGEGGSSMASKGSLSSSLSLTRFVADICGSQSQISKLDRVVLPAVKPPSTSRRVHPSANRSCPQPPLKISALGHYRPRHFPS